MTLYFGPNELASDAANWVRNTPGKNFFLYFRFYGPLEPYFDKTWKLGDVELIK